MTEQRKKLTLPGLFKKAAEGKPITWLTCYDYPTAYLQEQAGVDMILVGDSLGMTMLGYDSTLPVTIDDMIRHSAAVRRGAPNTFIVGDMPYMSYQPSNEAAVRNAGRFMAEAGCDSIKLEGGSAVCERIRAIVDSGIPAIGHLGLTPQSVSSLGGFRLQGKSAAAAKKILDDAKALEEAGAFMILLELVPDRLCQLVTERAKNCLIMSLGSGPHAHGQLLIYHDAFALYRSLSRAWPKFSRMPFCHPRGFGELCARGERKTFPAPENWFGMTDEEYNELLSML
jgi:3-methyl-2-oxobutanoate hydroxymethyltransferase